MNKPLSADIRVLNKLLEIVKHQIDTRNFMYQFNELFAFRLFCCTLVWYETIGACRI